MSNPLEILSLPEDATPDVVTARWRVLASEHHPDKGGDAQMFNHYRQAYEAALELVNQPRPCLSCNGTGKAEVRRGFSRVELMCSMCNGLGVRE